jgi:hypothetical protein
MMSSAGGFYDHRKTTEPDDGAERLAEAEEEPKQKHAELPASRINIALVTLNTEVVRLRASHDALLAAAKQALTGIAANTFMPNDGPTAKALRAAIAKAEELAP